MGMPGDTRGGMVRDEGMHILTRIDMGDVDADPLITPGADVTAIEAETDTSDRPHHVRQGISTDPIMRIPHANQRITSPDREVLPPGAEIQTQTSAGVCVERMPRDPIRVGEELDGARARGEEDVVAGMGEEGLVGLDGLREERLLAAERRRSRPGVDGHQRIVFAPGQQHRRVGAPGQREAFAADLDLGRAVLGANVPEAHGAVAAAASELGVPRRVPRHPLDRTRVPLQLRRVLDRRFLGVPDPQGPVGTPRRDQVAGRVPRQSADAVRGRSDVFKSVLVWWEGFEW